MRIYNTPEGTIPTPVLSLILMGAVIALAFIVDEAFEREERRQRIVQQYNCEHYGPSIARWAEAMKIENPCAKLNDYE